MSTLTACLIWFGIGFVTTVLGFIIGQLTGDGDITVHEAVFGLLLACLGPIAVLLVICFIAKQAWNRWEGVVLIRSYRGKQKPTSEQTKTKYSNKLQNEDYYDEEG